MKSTSLLVISTLFLLTLSQKHKWNSIVLSPSVLSFSQEFDHDNDILENQFEVSLGDSQLIKDKNFFLILESENSDFVISVFNGGSDGEEKREKIILDLMTHSGNSVIAMSDSFFNGQFDFFKQSGILRFKISCKSKFGNKNYRISVQIDSVLNLSFDKIYTTRIDSTMPTLKTNLSYSGSKLADLNKVRFQITAVHQKRDFSMSATVADQNGKYIRFSP